MERDFAAMTMEERLGYIGEHSALTEEDLALIHSGQGLTAEKADAMVEQVVGVYGMPYSVVPEMVINGKSYIVPMAGEEPYVTVSTSKGARIAAANGGFSASNTGSLMIGQIQLLNVPNPFTAKVKILEQKAKICEIANTADPVLAELGGGCKDVEVRVVDSIIGPMVVVHLIIDVLDAMGAQAINGMAEKVTECLEELSGGKANIRVLSNLAIYRLVRVRITVKKEDVGGEANVDKIVSAYAFADADPFRATTNNKGVMNGMIPVVVATGNDTRTAESGVHSYAALGGRYKSVTVWEKNKNGDLEGAIEVPMAVGIVGGTTRQHPVAQLSLKLMGIESAAELAQVIVATGLAANLGVLHSLVTAGLKGDFDAARGK